MMADTAQTIRICHYFAFDLFLNWNIEETDSVIRHRV